MTEEQRLLIMLNENKISENDFKILSAALDKRSLGISKFISIAINPFQKIAGIKALLAGVIVLLLMSYIGFYEKIYFTGILNVVSITEISNPKIPYTFTLVIYQNAVSCITLSIVYIIFSKIFQQKRLRIIDFFGTVALSRLPFLIALIIWMLLQTLIPDFFINPASELRPSWISAVSNLVNMLIALWQIATYFYALKESSGLTGNKLWISAIGSLVVAAVISAELTMFFV